MLDVVVPFIVVSSFSLMKVETEFGLSGTLWITFLFKFTYATSFADTTRLFAVYKLSVGFALLMIV